MIGTTVLRPACCWLVLAALACSKEEHQPPRASESHTEQDKAAALEPELAQAVAAASAQPGAQDAPSSADGDGPPPRGIFPPGGADAQISLDAAPKITVGSTGSEPRVRLEGGFGSKQAPLKSRIQVILQSGPGQGGLPVDFDVEFEPAPTAPAGAGEAREKREVRAKVVAAGVPRGLGQMPPELGEGLGKLRGSEVRFEQWPDGGATGFRTEVKQGTPTDLMDVVRVLSDVIATVTLPYPEEALGAGGYWMVTSRDGVMGLDLVTYRLVRVESVVEGVATLEVGTKRYAAGTDFSLAGLEGQFTLEEFQSAGQGSLRYQSGISMPQRGQLELSLAALVAPMNAEQLGGQPGQRGRLDLMSQARFGSR